MIMNCGNVLAYLFDINDHDYGFGKCPSIMVNLFIITEHSQVLIPRNTVINVMTKISFC